MPIVFHIIAFILISTSPMYDDRGASQLLVANGITPSIAASAGVSGVELQQAMNELRIAGLPMQYSQAVNLQAAAAVAHSAAAERYLQDRTQESAEVLRSAIEQLGVAKLRVETISARVQSIVGTHIGSDSATAIERSKASASLGLPMSCRFVDPEELCPVELAQAIKCYDRASRRGATQDRAVLQTIQDATDSIQVRTAEANLRASGDSLQYLYDIN